jgi:hypothetical protein
MNYENGITEDAHGTHMRTLNDRAAKTSAGLPQTTDAYRPLEALPQSRNRRNGAKDRACSRHFSLLVPPRSRPRGALQARVEP